MNSNRLRSIAVRCVVLGIQALLLTQVAGAVTFRTVALSQQHAPGALVVDQFASFDIPVINNAGQTAFYATLQGFGVIPSNAHGIWSEGGGSLQMVARAGTAAPGTGPDLRFRRFMTPLVISDQGDTAFLAELRHADGVSFVNHPHGIWSGKGGDVRRVVREGEPAPGTPFRFSVLENPSGPNALAISKAGHISFYARITDGNDGGSSGGIWLGGAVDLKLVALERSPAPGTEAGVVFASQAFPLFPWLPAIDDAGQTAFFARVQGPGVDGSNNEGI